MKHAKPFKMKNGCLSNCIQWTGDNQEAVDKMLSNKYKTDIVSETLHVHDGPASKTGGNCYLVVKKLNWIVMLIEPESADKCGLLAVSDTLFPFMFERGDTGHVKRCRWKEPYVYTVFEATKEWSNNVSELLKHFISMNSSLRSFERDDSGAINIVNIFKNKIAFVGPGDFLLRDSAGIIFGVNREVFIRDYIALSDDLETGLRRVRQRNEPTILAIKWLVHKNAEEMENFMRSIPELRYEGLGGNHDVINYSIHGMTNFLEPGQWLVKFCPNRVESLGDQDFHRLLEIFEEDA